MREEGYTVHALTTSSGEPNNRATTEPWDRVMCTNVQFQCHDGLPGGVECSYIVGMVISAGGLNCLSTPRPEMAKTIFNQQQTQKQRQCDTIRGRQTGDYGQLRTLSVLGFSARSHAHKSTPTCLIQCLFPVELLNRIGWFLANIGIESPNQGDRVNTRATQLAHAKPLPKMSFKRRAARLPDT